jgi:hypothetical protein
MAVKMIAVFVTAMVALLQATAAEPDIPEKLYNFLTKDNPSMDPGFGTELRVAVFFMCVNLDESTHVLTSRVIESYAWIDNKKVWDPAEYDGITKASSLYHEVWTPDLHLMNAFGEAEKRDLVRPKFRPNGTVFWLPYATYKTFCVPSVAADDNSFHCRFSLSSWTYDGPHIPLKLLFKGVDNKMAYIPECPYIVKNLKADIKRVKFTCCPKPYDSLEVHFDVERRADDPHVEHHDDEDDHHEEVEPVKKKACRWPHCKK